MKRSREGTGGRGGNTFMGAAKRKNEVAVRTIWAADVLSSGGEFLVKRLFPRGNCSRDKEEI